MPELVLKCPVRNYLFWKKLPVSKVLHLKEEKRSRTKKQSDLAKITREVRGRATTRPHISGGLQFYHTELSLRSYSNLRNLSSGGASYFHRSVAVIDLEVLSSVKCKRPWHQENSDRKKKEDAICMLCFISPPEFSLISPKNLSICKKKGSSFSDIMITFQFLLMLNYILDL